MTAIPNIGIFGKKQEMSKTHPLPWGTFRTNHQKKSINSGRCEVIRKGLRLVDEREQKIKMLRDAIEAGKKWFMLKILIL
ncbi:MAG: type II toxin-antitoxin system ParD family antitoxin [Saprospiraceae bacterium]|nr:type II toxin-antitoxin system ParD family antitoxin [Saprospiraceae bacterium]